MKVHIYGIDYQLPQVPAMKFIDGFRLPKKQQKWRKQPLPDIFDELEYDEDGDPIFTNEQLDFIDQELDRIDRGFWFYNNGTATYITGLHYFYLQYWTLENGEHPEYRAADRRYFYFQDYCESQPYIDGIIRSKKRREGATSQATADLVKCAITIKKAFCGIVSKSGPDARKVFINMIRPAFNGLPVFLKPTCEDPDSKTELSFNRQKRTAKKKAKARKKGQLFDEDFGLGSRLDYMPTELNSYDSGRLTKVLVEEGGKWPVDVPINEYWEIVRRTLKMGGLRVGFALLPSTSNKMTKGGKGFKILWDNSNQFKNKITGSGLYRYFCPADEGYAPYIDEYGESILSKPTIEQAKWMKQHYGATDLQCSMSAREWIEYECSLIETEEGRKEFQRQHPLNEKQAFDYGEAKDIYDRDLIVDQRQYLQENPVHLRRGEFYRDFEGKSQWIDKPGGMWHILKMPEPEEINKTIEVRGRVKPANTHKYVLVADPFKNTLTVGPGSKGCGIIGTKLNPMDKENTGMPIALFYGRPKLKRDFHKQMLLGAEFFGCEMGYESDIDDFIEFCMQEKKTAYMMVEPESVIDPNRKKRNEKVKRYGVKSGDRFSYAMMIDCSQTYVLLYCNKLYFDIVLEQLENYDDDERTKFDAAVAFQLFTVCIADPVKPEQKKEPRKQPIVQTYKVKL